MANLILTICSNRKRPACSKIAAKDYDFNAEKITDSLPDDMRKKLTSARQQAFRHITQPSHKEISSAGSTLNKGLKLGPDIDPDTQREGGFYMPALERYDGRFFGAFQKKIGNVSDFIHKRCEESNDHLLIISGLYGVLTPAEPIQGYNCDIPDEREIRQLWKENNLLTEVIISYIKKFGISRIFDFMADDSYRHLIGWELIREEASCTIFYPRCVQQTGVDMLPEFGCAVAHLLDTQDSMNLSDVTFGTKVGGVTFTNNEPVWIPAGTTFSKREICVVWAIRMMANIDKFQQGREIPQWIKNAMDEIRKFRNDVVHEPHFDPTPRLDEVRERYKQVVNWAKNEGCEELEDVDY